jgi:hypothetical protein
MSDEQLSLDLDLDAVEPASTSPAGSAAAPAPRAHRRGGPARVSPFNYTDAVSEVVRDVVSTLEELRHVDLDRVLLSIAQARQATTHGLYASCMPLRFEGGAREATLRKHRYRMPLLQHEGREVLYLLYFMLPRFHEEQDYHGKLATIIHELYHISPLFNGDIRRFPGKNFAHGHSREVYHAAMCRLADRYLEASPRARSHAFLGVPFPELLKRPGGVVGRCIPKPKAVLVKAPAARR